MGVAPIGTNCYDECFTWRAHKGGQAHLGYAGQDSDTHAVGELPHEKSTLRGQAVQSLVLTAAPRTQTAPGAAAMAKGDEMHVASGTIWGGRA